VRVLLVHSDNRPFEVERFGAAWLRAGGRVGELLSVTPATAATVLASAAGTVNGLLLTGGPDVEPARYGSTAEAGVELHLDPGRDALDFELLCRAEACGWPVLAVCYGCQILAAWRGGSLVQDLELAGKRGHRVSDPKDFLAHTVSLDGSTRLLRSLPASFAVNSRHHQAVLRPGNGLRVVASAPDGVVEAIEGDDRERFVLGVQWHPENIAGDPHDLVFRLFRESCRERERLGGFGEVEETARGPRLTLPTPPR